MNPEVSVIVTAYNHELYVKQCLQSVFSQTYINIKLLIINDGSKDNTDSVIKSVINESPFSTTKYINQENRGVCKTRNTGLEWNDSEFVIFVDADDFLDNDFIYKMVRLAENEKKDIVYCDLYDFENQRTQIQARPFELRSLLQNNYISNCSLIRSSKIGNIRYDVNLNRKFLEDYDFILQLILNGNAQPIYCDEVKLNYRILNNSVSRKENHDTLSYHYEIYCYILLKFLSLYPNEVFDALKDNIFVLEGRLTELIKHHFELESYIENLKRDINELTQNNIEKDLKYVRLEKRADQLFYDNQALLHSTSYRLGNAIIKPMYLAKRALRNPKLIIKAGKRGKNYLVKRIRRLPRPSMYCKRLVKDISRSRYQLENTKRYLIYVIFEDQKDIQEYKYLFLDHLAKFADKVLIISNSQLNNCDMRHLSRYGEVRIRENKGYDTAAFRYGILEAYPDLTTDFSELILANDTSIGPITDFSQMFDEMDAKKLDFWGVTFGEEQDDITGYNRYNYIPKHLQSYFLAIRRNMFLDPQFLKYWENLTQTDSREEAIGKHETVFTKYFSDLGYRYDAYVRENSDSAMYIHPLKMLKLGVPLIKYSALANYDDNQFVWQGLQRKSEIPELLEYVKMNSKYPVRLIHNIIEEIKNKPHEEYILIIDGVQNIIPQCTRYRVLNKQEYLENHGYKVKVVNLSDFQMKDIRYASTIIVYRAPYSAMLDDMVELAHQKGTKVYFDIDDLVIDTKYTDQLSYVRGLSKDEKANYDSGVINYGKMLQLCDGVITSTARLVKELSSYTPQVMLERNIASKKLIEISKKASNKFTDSTKVKIGYFSGSISHNENFNLIKYDILKILKECSNVELHLVGYLDIPEEFEVVKNQLVFHKYVDWQELPTLISEVDINLAPLTTNIFNEAKSEIKWLEAALVKTPTVASDIGAFSDIVKNDITGFLCKDNEWFEKLKMCIENRSLCNKVAENAYFDVINHHSFNTYYGDLLTELEKEENNG